MRTRTVCFATLSACLTLCACSRLRSPASGPDATESTPVGRLPDIAVPQSYDWVLTLDPATPRFAGHVRIHMTLGQAVRRLWLHGQDLHVTRAVVNAPERPPLPAVYRQVTPEGVASLDVPEAIGPGAVDVDLSYDAPFNPELDGLYKVRVRDENYIFSQFEAVAARRALPCLDEPRFKAEFRITVRVPPTAHVISNTAARRTNPAEDGFKTVVFEPTPPLPTYLLALAVGPFDVIQGTDVPANRWRATPLPLRGVAVQGQGAKLAYALAHTGELVALVEGYFGLPFPFSKLDVIAVPDFPAGAMENAGAITFRDNFLLVDSQDVTDAQSRRFGDVMAHELVHQWFGDLVSMSWWDDLWLNEAFSAWLGTRIGAAWQPRFHIDIEARQGLYAAMDQDSSSGARPITQRVTSVRDIHTAFDLLTYQKGCGVLTMFENLVGAQAMQASVHRYLEAFQFKTATAPDFVRALAVVDPTISGAFESFTRQAGVPLVQVELTCTGTTGQLQLSQTRYLPLGALAPNAGAWQIPVCVRYAAATHQEAEQTCFMLRAPQARFTLPVCPAWLMPNAAGAGYYRWSMRADLLGKLHEAPLTAAESLSLADSVSAGFAAGHLSTSDALRLMAPFAAAQERTVATAPFALWRFIYDEVLSEKERPAAALWMGAAYAKTLLPLAGRGTKAAVDPAESLWRHETMEFLGTVLHDQAAQRLLSEWGAAFLGFGADDTLHQEAVEPALRDVALAVAADTRGANFLDAWLVHLDTNTDLALRQVLIAGLALVQSPDLAQRVRQLTLDPRLHSSEVLQILRSQMRRPTLRAAAWAWFKKHYDAIAPRLSDSDLEGLAQLCEAFCSTAAAQDAADFLAPKLVSLPNGRRTLAKVVEQIALCQARVAGHREEPGAMRGLSGL